MDGHNTIQELYEVLIDTRANLGDRVRDLSATYDERELYAAICRILEKAGK